jgi:acylphosphatase
MKQVHIFVSGFVQGVGYRAFVKKTAEKLKISGLVRNLGDRRVEIIAQGEEDKLKELAKKCEEGPFFAEVKNVVVDWEEMREKLDGFVIVRD